MDWSAALAIVGLIGLPVVHLAQLVYVPKMATRRGKDGSVWFLLAAMWVLPWIGVSAAALLLTSGGAILWAFASSGSSGSANGLHGLGAGAFALGLLGALAPFVPTVIMLLSPAPRRRARRRPRRKRARAR